MNKKCIMIACAFFVAVALQAKVSLPAFFSDGMVMQHRVRPVFGAMLRKVKSLR